MSKRPRSKKLIDVFAAEDAKEEEYKKRRDELIGLAVKITEAEILFNKASGALTASRVNGKSKVSFILRFHSSDVEDAEYEIDDHRLVESVLLQNYHSTKATMRSLHDSFQNKVDDLAKL